MVAAHWRARAPRIFAACAVWVVGWWAYAELGPAQPWPDGSVDPRLARLYPSLHAEATAVDNMNAHSHFAVVLAVLLLICLLARSARAVVALGFSLVAVLGTAEVLKDIVERTVSVGADNTFPSAHAATATAIATFIALLAGRAAALEGHAPDWLRTGLTVLGWVIVVVASASVLITADHRFSDVIAGVAIGGGGTLACCSIVDIVWARLFTSGP